MKVTKEFIRPDSGKPASVALGLFDGIHIGHTKVLQRALKNYLLEGKCVGMGKGIRRTAVSALDSQ